mmetsp:Transcript_9677/g.22629  ORF Transcript_9677/g.22629 Transcript_9677/m.22629 type:complete len:84 (-) Transcript_9677:26-277(-)
MITTKLSQPRAGLQNICSNSQRTVSNKTDTYRNENMAKMVVAPESTKEYPSNFTRLVSSSCPAPPTPGAALCVLASCLCVEWR